MSGTKTNDGTRDAGGEICVRTWADRKKRVSAALSIHVSLSRIAKEDNTQ